MDIVENKTEGLLPYEKPTVKQIEIELESILASSNSNEKFQEEDPFEWSPANNVVPHIYPNEL